jgi:hypothetical protein
MPKQTVFLVGATGETGGSILNALIEDGSFVCSLPFSPCRHQTSHADNTCKDITCFIRCISAPKPSTENLKALGLKVVTGDLSDPISTLASLLIGIDTVISVLFPLYIHEQIPLVDAAVLAGVKRFVPCNFTTPCPRGGIFSLRDAKELVHDHIFRARMGFTIIDVGYWYQSTFPRVPSGRFDYAAFMPINSLYAGGTARNMITDKMDVGKTTVLCIKDDRTLNKRVYAYGEVLSQNDITAIVEKKSGEKLEMTPVRASLFLTGSD